MQNSSSLFVYIHIFLQSLMVGAPPGTPNDFFRRTIWTIAEKRRYAEKIIKLKKSNKICIFSCPCTESEDSSMQNDPGHLWHLRHLIRVIRRHDLTNKKKRQRQRQRQWQIHLENTFWRILGLSWLWKSERRGGKYSRGDDDNDNDNDDYDDDDNVQGGGLESACHAHVWWVEELSRIRQ